MAEVLQVTIRESRGKRRMRRMRAAGTVPAILYGHGRESISLAVSRDDLSSAIHRGAKLVELVGGVAENALIREVQWDTYGRDVLHVDFTRVDVGEKVEMVVAISLRGEAPGTKQGGVVEQLLHDVSIECPVISLPERFEININSLELGETFTLGAIELPEGATLLSEATAVVVQCVTPMAEREDTEDGEGTTAEPEVIGRKAEESEEEDK